jgi:hypothetical protein
MVTDRLELGKYRFDLAEDLSFIVLQIMHINSVAGCGSWLRCYHERGTYLALSHAYKEIPM